MSNDAMKSESRLSRSPSPTHPSKPQIYCHALHSKCATSTQRGGRCRPLISVTEEQLMKELSIRCGKNTVTWSSPTQHPLPPRLMTTARCHTKSSPATPKSRISTGRRSGGFTSTFSSPRLSTSRLTTYRSFATIPTGRGEDGGSTPTQGGDHGGETSQRNDVSKNRIDDSALKRSRRDPLSLASPMRSRSGRRKLLQNAPPWEENGTHRTNPVTTPMTTTHRSTKNESMLRPSSAARLRGPVAPSTSFFSGSHFYAAA